MAEFIELLMKIFYSFLQRFSSFTLLEIVYNEDKKPVEEDEGLEDVLSLKSREFKTTELMAVAPPRLPKPTQPTGPQTN